MTVTEFAAWLITTIGFLVGLAFVVIAVVNAIQDHRAARREVREIDRQHERQWIVQTEHDLFLGPFADHPADCELCRRDMKQRWEDTK